MVVFFLRRRVVFDTDLCLDRSMVWQEEDYRVHVASSVLFSSRDHPAGMKYIHFWAPLMKWSLVGAGFGDMLRPADKLSLNQSISLFATGAIWSRYSMVIVPKNYMLFAVNVFLAFVGGQQLARIAYHRYTHPETSTKT